MKRLVWLAALFAHLPGDGFAEIAANERGYIAHMQASSAHHPQLGQIDFGDLASLPTLRKVQLTGVLEHLPESTK
ncbi:MAG: hypothetical protein V7676_13820 [Parasphingorhabdus sp.]|uniref:hypothetical protein n=1 Tax=Parasphingorhabdus sp. TaxID=2709688 RepID=UPI0030028FA4